ncbi:hypothetical protein [Roseateles chitinivorans]|uniref:hypothetical protein n=1 Tax=Roseateles chitinivorans TaxID=2917965 RepID=UPI003D67289E
MPPPSDPVPHELPDLSMLVPAELREVPEEGFLTRPEELDLSLRAWAARGGMATAAVLYAAGLFALGVFVGVFEPWPAVSADKWHIVVTTVVALFSVPTMILLTIIRSSSSVKTEPDAATKNFHTLIGEKLLNLLEKLADKVIAKN